MHYIFNAPAERPARRLRKEVYGDRRDGAVYCYDDTIILAINVALAARRPLLVAGPSGSGKSSMARHIAATLKWRYIEHVVTSRTQAQDLLWWYDTVRRLSDAQTKAGVKQDYAYIEPGALWWAFSPDTAARRGRDSGLKDDEKAHPPYEGTEADPCAPAVVLIDEIDKADPDVPNSLLVPLGSFTFRVAPVGSTITPEAAEPPLIIITTNEERELPPAFRRRCIELRITPPSQERLRRIAMAHFGSTAKVKSLCDKALGLIERKQDGREISTAQFLDAIRACLGLDVEARSDDAQKVMEAAWDFLNTQGA